MEKELSSQVAKVLTLDVIELIGDDACTEINEMQNNNVPDNKIVDYIQRRLATVSGKLVNDDCGLVLDLIRTTTKYQAYMITLHKGIKTDLPVRIARNRCFELVDLRGFTLMDDHDVAENLIRNLDIRMIAKALAVEDFMRQVYNVSLSLIRQGECML